MDLADNPERRTGGYDFILARAAETYPDRTAIDDRLNAVRLSYAELRARVMRLARALRRLGVQKGDRVAYAFFNEHASIEAMFACSVLGAVAVPLNTRLHKSEASRYISAQECEVFLAREDLAGFGDDASVKYRIVRGTGKRPSGALDYETLLGAEEAAALPPAARWEDPLMLAMTGGTTAGSKSVVWTHGGCMIDVLTVIVHLGVKRDYKTIAFAPTYHAVGLGRGFMPSFWQAGTVIFPATPGFSPAFLHQVAAVEDVHYVMLVPGMIEPLYRAWDGRPIGCLKSVSVSSAPTPLRLRRQLAEMFPTADLMMGYGMTESFSISLQRPADFLGHPEGVGEPSLDARVRIVDDDGRSVPRGEVGHIVARTLAMGLYYNNDAENTRLTFRRCTDDPEGMEWIFTGDLGRLDPDGRVTIVDRAKDIIISGGENVSSAEVEAAIIEHPKVRECAIVGLPDERWGEAVCAVVVKTAEDIADEALAREILAHCRRRLGGYKLPKRIAFLDVLPRSPFGKVLKRDLRKSHFARLVDLESEQKDESKGGRA